MKTTIKLIIIGTMVLSLMLTGTAKTEAATITTTCNGGTTTSTINGRVLLNGSSTASVWFEWGPTTGLGNTTSRQTFSVDSNFSQPISGLRENTTYYYRALGSNDSGNETGDILSFTTVCTNTQELPTVDLRADDTTLDSGDSTNVRWTSSNADTCRGTDGRNGWSGNKNLSGTFYTGSLTTDTTYRITCTNEDGSVDDTITIRVNDEEEDRPTVNIYASPSSVNYNGSSTVTWNSSNADSCTANSGVNGWSGSKGLSGSFYTGNLTTTTTFNITCRNDAGSSTDSTTIGVISTPVVVNNLPTVAIYADNTNLAYNGATNIRWTTTNATSCFASGGSLGWAGQKSIGPAAFYTGSLTGARTYSITCSNDAGSNSDFVTVSVRGRVLGTTTVKALPSSYLLVTSSVDRNRPIVPTLDNTNPCPGDDVNYSITYQNVGNASLKNLVLRVDLPREVDYITSIPNPSTVSGQTLVFNLGTLNANAEGTVKIQVRVRNDAMPGANLNFPATLTYTDATGAMQSVSANVNASVCLPTVVVNNDNLNADANLSLGANVFGAGFLPTSILGWLLLLILILILVLLAKYLFGQSFEKRTVVMVDQYGNERTTTTSTH